MSFLEEMSLDEKLIIFKNVNLYPVGSGLFWLSWIMTLKLCAAGTFLSRVKTKIYMFLFMYLKL